MTTPTFALHDKFKFLPYVFAKAFIRSIVESARTTFPYYDTVGAASMAAPAPNTDTSATLVGIASDIRVTDLPAFQDLMNDIRRDPAFCLRAADNERPSRRVLVPAIPPVYGFPGVAAAPAVMEDKTEFNFRFKSWEDGTAAINALRTAVIAALPDALRARIMASPDVHRTTADIITAIRSEYIAILPTHEANKMVLMLKAKVPDDVPVGEAFQEFEDVYRLLPAHIKGTLGGHYRLETFLAKWPPAYQERARRHLDMFYATDKDRAWEGDIIDDMKEQIRGAREQAMSTFKNTLGVSMAQSKAYSAETADGDQPPTPDGDTATAAAVNRNSEDFAAGKKEGHQKALQTVFCFHHGYGTHTSLACTVMHANYGTYTEDNPHRAKYLCNTPGQNVDGVTSSTNKGGGGGGGGRGGGRGGGGRGHGRDNRRYRGGGGRQGPGNTAGAQHA